MQLTRNSYFYIGLLALGWAVTSTGSDDLDRDFAEAVRLEEGGKSDAALAVFRSLLQRAPAGDALRGRILEGIAGLETDAGDYPAAIRDARAAAAIHGAHGDVARQGSATNRVGLALLYAGDYRAAERELIAAIRLSSWAHDDAASAEAITNLANVEYFLGRYADAASHYDIALRIARSDAAQPWAARRQRIVLANQAILDQRLGRDEQALEIYRQMQATGKDLRPREQAQILVNLGVLYRHLGDPIKALATYDEARALFAREHHVDGELGVLKNRGIVLALDLNRLDAARANFSDALDRATKANNKREILQAELYRGETEIRLDLVDAARRDFQSSVELARVLKTPEEEWKGLYGLARTELRGGGRAAAREHLVNAVAVVEKIREAIRVPNLRSDFFNDKRVVYDALIDVELDHANVARIFQLIEQSHSRAWRERLGLGGDVSLKSVQGALPERVLLLDYWVTPSASAVVSVTRDFAEVRRISVDENSVRRLIEDLSRGPGREWRTSASIIAANALPPKLPAGTRHIIAIADGAMVNVPLELLPLNGRLVVDQLAVSYIPTAAMLFRKSVAPSRTLAPWKVMMRGFGDPHFASAALDDANALRVQLAASAGEVRGIASQLGGRSILHLGGDDRKAYLFETSSAPILHIASHATADANTMEQSRIVFSPPSGQTGADYLFLKEAYELPLKDVELAVLSACDTERGRLLRGEGLQSFSRAFLAAGARSTITTLWRVPDAPTAAFMRVFYHHLQTGASRAEALRLAKLRFVRDGGPLSDPHYWAAFVLTGEGQLPIPRALQWSTIALALGAALILVVAATLLLRR